MIKKGKKPGWCIDQDAACSWFRRVHLHVVGMLRFMSDTNQPSLPTPFYSVPVSISSFMALSTVFHSVNSPDNSPFSDSVFPVLSSALLVLSTICLFMRVSFSLVVDWTQNSN